MELNPVLFVHGIGASAKVWDKFELPDRNSYYLSFFRNFADPRDQVKELKAEIDRILQIEQKQKVVLVCHSMGGLTARQYLANNLRNHQIEKLILLSTPNLGSVGLSFNWLPALLIILGLVGYFLIWPLFFALTGLIWEVVSYFRGVLLLSPAAWAMRQNSFFLKELNGKKLPVDLKYIAVLSDTKVFPHRLVNLLLFHEGGDGAVPVSSQRLSLASVPNFPEIDYSEIHLDLPHFAVPQKAQSAVLKALQI